MLGSLPRRVRDFHADTAFKLDTTRLDAQIREAQAQGLAAKPIVIGPMKPMKGMLTGPVTILNGSFVRDDQPRADSCRQLALAMRAEVLDLERAGVRIIQVDEAALREGLPLRKSQWQEYLAWAVESFRIAANAGMDADVITIETSRSDMELLDAFEHFNYPNQIGPGVYDIHSPDVPSREHIVALMRRAAARCGLRRHPRIARHCDYQYYPRTLQVPALDGRENWEAGRIRRCPRNGSGALSPARATEPNGFWEGAGPVAER